MYTGKTDICATGVALNPLVDLELELPIAPLIWTDYSRSVYDVGRTVWIGGPEGSWRSFLNIMSVFY